MSWDFGSTGSGGPGWDSPPLTNGAPPHQADPPAPAGPATSDAPGAPWHWLLAGFGVATAALVLGVLGGFVPSVVGWVLGGPVAIGLFAVFVTVDGRRRAEPWYAGSAAADGGRRLLVVACLVAVALNAWQIADHISRSGGGA